jgi:hypothetical protein
VALTWSPLQDVCLFQPSQLYVLQCQLMYIGSTLCSVAFTLFLVSTFSDGEEEEGVILAPSHCSHMKHRVTKQTMKKMTYVATRRRPVHWACQAKDLSRKCLISTACHWLPLCLSHTHYLHLLFLGIIAHAPPLASGHRQAGRRSLELKVWCSIYVMNHQMPGGGLFTMSSTHSIISRRICVWRPMTCLTSNNKSKS